MGGGRVRRRSLTRWIARAAAALVRANPVAPAPDDYAAMFQTLYGTPDLEKIWPVFEQNAQAAYSGNAVVFGLANKRLMLFTEARFCFRKLDDGTLDKTHPALSKLNGNAWLKARLEQDASLAGNCYVRDCGNDELERLRPDWVTIVSEVTEDEFGREVRRVIGYAYEPLSDTGRHTEFYTADEVAHYAPIPDPLANWRGMSWLSPVVREVNADIAMSEHAYAYFTNAATPNLIIKYAQKLNSGQVDHIRDMVAARHTGSQNAFTTMLLDLGADPMVVGSQLTDVSFTALQAAGENRLAVAAGVPAIVAGLKEGLAASTLANYREAVESFADLTMRPLWRIACGSLAPIVDVPDGYELWYDTTDISALQQGEKELAETLSVAAATISSLITSGYEPDSVIRAVTSGDLTLLKHTGRYSVQLLPPGADGASAGGTAKPAAVDKPAPPATAQRFVDGAGVAWVWDEELLRWSPELHPRDARGRFRKVAGADLVDAVDVTRLSDKRLLGLFGDLSLEDPPHEEAMRRLFDEMGKREERAAVRSARKTNPLAGRDVGAMSDDELVDLRRAHPGNAQVDTAVRREVQLRNADREREERSRPLVDWDVHGSDTLEQRRIDKLVAAGVDYRDAYADAYHLDRQSLLAEERATVVDLDRLAGETRRQAVRRAYGEYVHLQYLAAEDATTGNVLNARGRAKGVDPVSLFSGPGRVARAYASEELLRYWGDNGRVTYGEFEAQVLTGDTRLLADAKARGNGQEFGV